MKKNLISLTLSILILLVNTAKSDVIIYFSPSLPVDFGYVNIGQESTKSLYILTNSSNSSNFTGTLSSGTGGAFTLSCISSCSINISPNNSYLIATIKFMPTTDGAQGTAFYITSHNADNYGSTIIINVTGNGVQPVPVELTDFKASLNNNSVNINWNTATEINNYGFEIERSVNNNIFEKIGFVQGCGNSNSPKHYSYDDDGIYSSGKYSYRLKQIDTDGSYEYSSIKDVLISNPSITKLKQNYPNPSNPSTTIEYELPSKDCISIKIYDIAGKIVRVLLNEEKESGRYKIIWDGLNDAKALVSSGTYFYQIQTSNIIKTKKMILLK